MVVNVVVPEAVTLENVRLADGTLTTTFVPGTVLGARIFVTKPSPFEPPINVGSKAPAVVGKKSKESVDPVT